MTSVTFCAYDKPDSVGGPVTWIQRLLPAMRDRGIDVRCLFLLHYGETGPALENLRKNGIECVATLAHERTADRTRWILEQLSARPTDVFVPNLPVAAYFAAKYAREAGIPTVGILHSDDHYYRAIQDEFVFGTDAFKLSALICVSRQLEADVRKRNPSRTRVERIPYGVPDPAAISTRGTTFRIAYVGRLAEEQKRITEVTKALCRASREIEGVEGLIFGDGPERSRVEQILADEGRGLPVTLGGNLPSDEVQSRLAACHAIVLLSDYEGLPIAMMEAMAGGCVPVCLSMRSGIPELVHDGVNGLIVSDREDSFIEAIRRLNDNEELWKRLSGAAASTIREGFSNDLCADRWAKLVEDLASESAGRQPVSIPSRIRLPSPDPRLESSSYRIEPPSRFVRLYRSVRMFLGRIRRSIFHIN